MTKDLAERRVVLVTGASSGIGLATAIATASAGWDTVATTRNPARAQALLEAAHAVGVSIDVRRLDVTDPALVQDCLDDVVAAHGSLDVLVNNAGAAHVGTIETDDMDEFRQCVEVNFFGVVQVTRAAMPHLQASRGRVITVSSVGGVVGQPFNEAYCAAKFAVEGFMEALAPVSAAVGVDVCVIEPGAVTSSFIANAGLDPVAMLQAAGPYAGLLDSYLQRTTAQFSGSAQPADEAAQVIAEAMSATPLPFRLQTSAAATAFVSPKLADLDGSAVQSLTRPWVTP